MTANSTHRADAGGAGVSERLREHLLSLTLHDLRDVSLSTRGPEAPLGRSKDALVESLMSSVELNALARCARRIEALAPKKHVWLFGLGSAQPSTLESSVADRIRDRFESQIEVSRSSDVGSSPAEFVPVASIFDAKSRTFYASYEHSVVSQRWDRISETRKELRTERIRHVVVGVIRCDIGTLEIRFDGYSQGVATAAEARLTYQQLAVDVASRISALDDREAVGLQLSAAVERLLDTMPSEVRDTRRSVRPAQGGGLTLEAGEGNEDPDVAAFLAQFVSQSGLSLSAEDRRAIRAALSSSPTSSVFLLWRDLDLISRFSFSDVGTELLFIWRSSSRSAASLAYVIDCILLAYQGLGRPAASDVLAFILAKPDGSVTRVSDLTHRFGLAAREALQLLEEARRRSEVRPVFRANTTEPLQEYTNVWRASLSELPLEVTTADGVTLSLQAPSNIEIGFERHRGAL